MRCSGEGGSISEADRCLSFPPMRHTHSLCRVFALLFPLLEIVPPPHLHALTPLITHCSPDAFSPEKLPGALAGVSSQLSSITTVTIRTL